MSKLFDYLGSTFAQQLMNGCPWYATDFSVSQWSSGKSVSIPQAVILPFGQFISKFNADMTQVLTVKNAEGKPLPYSAPVPMYDRSGTDLSNGRSYSFWKYVPMYIKRIESTFMPADDFKLFKANMKAIGLKSTATTNEEAFCEGFFGLLKATELKNKEGVVTGTDYLPYTKEALSAEVATAFVMLNAGLRPAEPDVKGHREKWLTLARNQMQNLIWVLHNADYLSRRGLQTA